MSTNDLSVFILLLFAALIGGGFILIFGMLRSRTRLRELAIKERIALIEKGLVPSPEVDPARFEALIGGRRTPSLRGARYKTAGVMLMGLGVGLLLLISFAANEPQVGFGVGGGMTVIGLAALLNGVMQGADE